MVPPQPEPCWYPFPSFLGSPPVEGDFEDDQLPCGPRKIGFSQVRGAEKGVMAALSRGPLPGFLGLDELGRDVQRCHHLYLAAVWGP